MDDEILLSCKQAYLAMYAYLEILYRDSGSDTIAGFLSDLSLLPNGKTADPAAWKDWMACVHKALNNEVDADLSLR